MSFLSLKGWYVDYTEGLPALRLSIIDEGYITQPTDTPANAVYKSRILNAEEFSFSMLGTFWPLDGEGAPIGAASYAPLQIDNYDGTFDALVGANLRDMRVKVYLVPASMLGGATTVASSRPVFTAVIDDIKSSSTDVVTITLRGVLATFDRTLPVRRFPPFANSAVAGTSLPILLGACRSVTPPSVDGPNRIYQLSDGQVTNVVAVRDKGAPLDPSATPPQFTPARNSTCLQLQTDPEGKLTVDASSVGTQAPTPGVPDILGGKGLLTDWPNASNPPTGWTYGNPAYGTFARLDHNQSPQDYVAAITTSKAYSPSSGSYGQYMSYPANLQPGKTYRISFMLYRTLAQYGAKVGLMVRTDLTQYSPGAISDNLLPLQQPLFQAQAYTYVYTCPPGAARPIYMIAVGDPSYSAAAVYWYGLQIQEMGQYVEQPLLGAGLSTMFRELLVVRDGQDPSVYADSDLQAIDGSSNYQIGRYYSEPPNILSALRELCDTYCATVFEDSDGVIRVARLADPAYGIPIADFGPANILPTVDVSEVSAEYLTTRIGARRNWSPSTDSDFVSDTVTLPIAKREAMKRTSQFERTATVVPAGHYSAALNAPVFHSLHDDPDQAQGEINRVVSLFAPATLYGRDPFSGKRRVVTIEATFDDPTSIGLTTKCALQDLLIGKIVSVTYPKRGLSNALGYVLGTAPYPFAGKIKLWVFV